MFSFSFNTCVQHSMMCIYDTVGSLLATASHIVIEEHTILKFQNGEWESPPSLIPSPFLFFGFSVGITLHNTQKQLFCSVLL